MLFLFGLIFIVQVVVQIAAYRQSKGILFKLNRMLLKFIKWLLSIKIIKNVLSKFNINNIDSFNIVMKIVAMEMIVINLAITCFVAAITGVGLIAGATNLLASCILGCYQAYDVSKNKGGLLYV